MRPPCSIEGCEKESKGRGWCNMHWRRWRTHGDPLVTGQRGGSVRTLGTCSVDGCDRQAHARDLYAKHYARFRKHGDPLVNPGQTGRPLIGEHPTWSAIHKRLARQRGKASEFACIDCGARAHEWSYDRTDPDELVGKASGRRGVFDCAYSLDLDRYVPRCTSCHRLFDRGPKPPTHPDAGQRAGALIRVALL